MRIHKTLGILVLLALAVFAALGQTGAAVMPEVWLGHHRGGEAAWVALARLTEAYRARLT